MSDGCNHRSGFDGYGKCGGCGRAASSLFVKARDDLEHAEQRIEELSGEPTEAMIEAGVAQLVAGNMVMASEAAIVREIFKSMSAAATDSHRGGE